MGVCEFKEICIISCGAKKVWSMRADVQKTIAAKDAYIGPLFKKTRSFADRFFPSQWYIISDKYGLIKPDELIEEYEISPEVIKTSKLFRALVDFQAHSFGIADVPNIITTSGKIHQHILSEVFPKSNITNPVFGLSQGKRMQKLAEILQ
jgi:hypothetical protein